MLSGRISVHIHITQHHPFSVWHGGNEEEICANTQIISHQPWHDAKGAITLWKVWIPPSPKPPSWHLLCARTSAQCYSDSPTHLRSISHHPLPLINDDVNSAFEGNFISPLWGPESDRKSKGKDNIKRPTVHALIRVRGSSGWDPLTLLPCAGRSGADRPEGPET